MNLSNKNIPLVWVESVIISILGDKKERIEEKVRNKIELLPYSLEESLQELNWSSKTQDIELKALEIQNYIGKHLNSTSFKNLIEIIIKEKEFEIPKNFSELSNGNIINFLLLKDIQDTDSLIEEIILEGIEEFTRIGRIGVDYTREELNIFKGKFGVISSSIKQEDISFTIKYIKNHFKFGANDSTRNSILEKSLNVNKRIRYSKEDLLSHLAEELKNNLSTSNFENWKPEYKKTGSNVLNFPISCLNIRKYFIEDRLPEFFEKINGIFSEIILNQINGNFDNKQINIFFLGNIINTEATKESDFTNTLIDYNLSIKLSVVLYQIFFLLKSYFPEVKFIFNVEKKLSDTDIEGEYFNDKNISGDFIVGNLLEKVLIKENSIYNSKHSYYNFINSQKNNILTVADLKSAFNRNLNGNDSLKLFDIEKELEKEIGQELKKNKILLDTIYIGSKHKHFFSSAGYTIRYIPKFDRNKLYLFTIDLDGKEKEITIINTNIINKGIISNLYTFNNEEIGHYSYINKTSIRNKVKENKIIVL